MSNYVDRLTTLQQYQRISYQGKRARGAVNACGRIEKASPGHNFKIQHPKPDTVVITRVPTTWEATRDCRIGKGMTQRWPFVGMLIGSSYTYTDAMAYAAVVRLTGLRHQHPELFFKIERLRRHKVMITRVSTDAEATRESVNKNWPFKDMTTGESFEFDVTFYSTEDRVKIGNLARSCGVSAGKKFSCRSTDTVDHRRILTVTRVK